MESFGLSPALLGDSETSWTLRICLLQHRPTAEPDGSFVILCARRIAGKRHLLAAAHVAVRDAMRWRAEANEDKRQEMDSADKYSQLLPGALWVRKKGSTTPDEFFCPNSDSDAVFVVRLDRDGVENGEKFATRIREMQVPVLPLSSHVPQGEELVKQYDLGPKELVDVDKAVCMRVAARDCL